VVVLKTSTGSIMMAVLLHGKGLMKGIDVKDEG
jgi:hypothetical protein